MGNPASSAKLSATEQMERQERDELDTVEPPNI